jgi:hypothetical protein
VLLLLRAFLLFSLQLITLLLLPLLLLSLLLFSLQLLTLLLIALLLVPFLLLTLLLIALLLVPFLLFPLLLIALLLLPFLLLSLLLITLLLVALLLFPLLLITLLLVAFLLFPLLLFLLLVGLPKALRETCSQRKAKQKHACPSGLSSSAYPTKHELILQNFRHSRRLDILPLFQGDFGEDRRCKTSHNQLGAALHPKGYFQTMSKYLEIGKDWF